MRQAGNRNIYLSSGLGAVALLCHLFTVNLPIEPGAMFLFVAAMAFGLEGAVYASMVAAIPLLVVSHDFVAAGRLGTLTILVGAWQSYGCRRLPLVVVGSAWNLFALSALVLANFSPALNAAVHSAANRATAAALFTSDLAAITLACALLSFDGPWYALCRRSRMTSVTNYLVLLISGTAVATLAVAVWVGWSGVGSSFAASMVLLVGSFAAIVPTIIFALSRRVFPWFRDDQTSTNLILNPDRDHGFSGNSAMYWRRREYSDTAGSESRMDIPGVPTDGFGPEYGICVIDGSGVITLANRKFIKLVGAVDRQINGKPFANLAIVPEILKTFIALVMFPSELKRSREVRFSDAKLRSDRFFELSVVPSSSAMGSLQGEPGTKILTIKEVTDRRAIERSLLHSQKLASLGTVVSGIGHAFNSALTTIIGRASHARLMTDPQVMMTGLNEIIAEAQRAETFVNKLLDFANDSPRKNAVFDARHFITERKELFKNILGTEHSLELTIPERSLGISCDPGLLAQALTNLLLNSRESLIGRSGRVTISLGLETIDPDVALMNVSAYPGTFVRIRISDTGLGMNSETVKHACEPTFTTKSSAGHSGLGLPTAFAIARAHDGFLTIESAPEQGTTISVYFPEVPLQNLPETLPAKRSTPTSEANANKPLAPRVLVLEDEPTVREMVAGMLESLGATVIACSAPQEALALAKGDSFDVAFVDLVMPTMGGNEWIGHLRAQNRTSPIKLPVVLMTGYGNSGEHDKSFHSILPKPFTMESLKEALEKAAKGNND